MEADSWDGPLGGGRLLLLTNLQKGNEMNKSALIGDTSKTEAGALAELGDLLESQGLNEYADCFRHPFWTVGLCYYIRCAVYSAVGRLLWINEKELVLDQAAYVGTDGRYGEAVRNGFSNEAEYEIVPRMLINRQAINDAVEWNHDLPTESQ